MGTLGGQSESGETYRRQCVSVVRCHCEGAPLLTSSTSVPPLPELTTAQRTSCLAHVKVTIKQPAPPVQKEVVMPPSGLKRSPLGGAHGMGLPRMCHVAPPGLGGGTCIRLAPPRGVVELLPLMSSSGGDRHLGDHQEMVTG